MINQEQLEDIRDKFTLPAFSTMWPIIHQRYQAMGFQDHLSDKERINEYKYIVEQYRKYIAGHEKQILKYENNLEDMLKVIEELITKAPEVDIERKVLVYYTLRDDWLTDLYNAVILILQLKEDSNV